MKKKAIEKTPYLKLKKTNKKRTVKYIAVTAVKNIGHERHLFCEVYENREKSKDIPVVRIVLTKKDFGTYFPETEEWNRKKIEPNDYRRLLIWHREESGRYDKMALQNILQSEEDLERIKKFCQTKIWNEERWWEYICEAQNEIAIRQRRDTEERRNQRRRDALKERIENTPELPEEQILRNADQKYFHEKHYLFYKKRNSRVEIACSSCGGVKEARWKRTESFEGQFQSVVEEPRENHTGRCPMCGISGVYKCQGKTKGNLRERTNIFLGQRYREQGLVIRYMEVEKIWHLNTLGGYGGEIMENAYEELSGVEIARAYFEPEKKVQTDYHKHNPYTGEDFWDDCNMYGLSSIRIDDAMVMPETYEAMKETAYRYSAMQEYAERVPTFNPIRYLKEYRETPQIEMLTKMGLYRITKHLIEGYHGFIACREAKRLDLFLGIRKERIRGLISSQGDIELLEVMKMEKRMQQEWTEEQIRQVAESGMRRGQIESALRYMTLQKLLNRISKYAGCGYGTDCSQARARIRHTATTYTDYLNMREELGYDLNNTVYQQPRDLEAAHRKMVAEKNREAEDERIRLKEEQYQNIRHSYRRLRNEYYYEDENYIIRPARSAGEIIKEGRILHHCVGGDNYLNKHNSEISYILMLRFKSEPEVPYITVEISAESGKILQWYGDKDKKPDEANMQNWLKRYVKELKNKTLAVAADIA